MENTTSEENQYLPFWQKVAEKMSDETVLNIVASKAGEIITLSVVPQKADKISPATLSGTAEDFAAEFFTAAFQPPPVAQAGLNVTAVPADAPKAPKKKETKKPATPAASGTKKKTVAKKPAPPAGKKPEPKKPAEEKKRGRGRPPGVRNKKGTKAQPVPPLPLPKTNQLDIETEAAKLVLNPQEITGPKQTAAATEITGEITAGDAQERLANFSLPETESLEQNTVEPVVVIDETAITPVQEPLPEPFPLKEYTKAHAKYKEWIMQLRDVAFHAVAGEPTAPAPYLLGSGDGGAEYFANKYFEGKTILQALTDAVNENHGECFFK